MAFIRPYRPSDFDATSHICRATLPPSLSSQEPARRLSPYIWTHPYTHLFPESCLVLDDGAGLAVGYCIACPDISEMCKPAVYGRYVAEVLDREALDVPQPEALIRYAEPNDREPWLTPLGVINEACLLQLARDPNKSLLEGNEDVMSAGYQATMHIDLLEAWQAQGWGKKLIEAVAHRVRSGYEAEAILERKGIWIGVAADNVQVLGFYEKVGFRRWPRDAQSGSVIMVKDIYL